MHGLESARPRPQQMNTCERVHRWRHERVAPRLYLSDCWLREYTNPQSTLTCLPGTTADSWWQAPA